MSLATGHPPVEAKIIPLSKEHVPGFLCCNVSGLPTATRKVDQDTMPLLTLGKELSPVHGAANRGYWSSLQKCVGTYPWEERKKDVRTGIKSQGRMERSRWERKDELKTS